MKNKDYILIFSLALNFILVVFLINFSKSSDKHLKNLEKEYLKLELEYQKSRIKEDYLNNYNIILTDSILKIDSLIQYKLDSLSKIKSKYAEKRAKLNASTDSASAFILTKYNSSRK